MTTEVENTPEVAEATQEVKAPKKAKKEKAVKPEPAPKPVEVPGLHLFKDLGLYKYDLGVKLKKDYDPELDAEELARVEPVLAKRGQVFGAEDSRTISSIVYSPADKRRIASAGKELAPGEKSEVSSIEIWRAQINKQKYEALVAKIDAWEASQSSGE